MYRALKCRLSFGKIWPWNQIYFPIDTWNISFKILCIPNYFCKKNKSKELYEIRAMLSINVVIEPLAKFRTYICFLLFSNVYSLLAIELEWNAKEKTWKLMYYQVNSWSAYNNAKIMDNILQKPYNEWYGKYLEFSWPFSYYS